MLFTVEQLIEGHQDPVTISPQETAKHALEAMIEHDFSQLPVVDDNQKPLGIVTSSSILRALNNFGVSLPDLQVSHALIKVDEYSLDENLFDLLDDLKNTYAVLIVNNDRKLIGIVTSFDTTEYFRRRAEDMMYVEDIESTLKDFIQTAFLVGADDTGKTALKDIIEELADGENRKKFQNALSHYLNLYNNSKINKDFAAQAFKEHFISKEASKTFDDLTLYEYIQLLLHKSKWPTFSSVFSLKSNAVDKFLKEVCKTRNDLAHFHGEISSKQRDQLHFCTNWLESHRTKVSEAFSYTPNELLEATETPGDTNPDNQHAVIKTAVTLVDETNISEEIHAESIPVNEVLLPDDSRYAPLAIWLQRQYIETVRISRTFNQIEEIIKDKLPLSARKHRVWWSNNLEINPQARQWWDAGWRVSTVNMNEETVVFTRIEERKKAYVDFFSSLLNQLNNHHPFPIRSLSPDGASWATVVGVPFNGPQVAAIGFSFARRKRFRVEMYIDMGKEKEQENKELLQKLKVRKEIIETELGVPVSWELLEGARASRIAIYRSGVITDGADKLAELRDWAVDTILRFQPIMEKHVSEVIHDL